MFSAVAVTIKYLDSIVKCLAVTVSVVITIILSHFLFGSTLTLHTMFGMVLMVSGVIGYNNSGLLFATIDGKERVRNS